MDLKSFLIYGLLLFSFQTAAQNSCRTSGRFIFGTQEDKTASISLGDIDNDGDLDIVAANGRHWPQRNQLYFNNGRGIFTVSKPLDLINETSYATELADLDGDGDLDIAVGNDMAPMPYT